MTEITHEALEALAQEYRLTMDKDIVHSWGGDAARALADIADALRTGQLIHAVPSVTLSDDQIKHMVNRFLGWKLPQNFHPDNGISFEPVGNKNVPGKEYRRDVSGTNLFDAVQATVMVRYMVEGLPVTQPSGDEVEAVAINLVNRQRMFEGYEPLKDLTPLDDEDQEFWRNEATAAITTLDAVRGKQ